MDLFGVLYIVICGIATLNSFLFAVYVFFMRKGEQYLNKIIAIFILTFSIRISKNLWIFFYPQVHPIVHALWFGSLFAMVFLYLSYIICITGRNSIKINRIMKWIFFLIPVIIVVFNFIPEGIDNLFFMAILIILLMVLVVTTGMIYTFLRKDTISEKLTRNWLIGIHSFILMIFINFSAVYIFRYNFFVTEAFLFSVMVYILVFVEIKYGIIVQLHKASKNPNPDDLKTIEQLKKIMGSEKLFRNPQLSLPLLAKSISLSPHQLSRIINETLNLNFNDYINGFRVEEVKKELAKEENKNIKIASIAFECGFNSISSFNKAFKRFTGKTPTQYQSELN